MAAIDEEFSPSERAELMRGWSAAILAAVVGEMVDRGPAEWSIDEYFQSPRKMIDAVLDFDDRHAAMRIRARKLQRPASEVNPHDQGAAERLREAVDRLLGQIADRLAAEMPDAQEAVRERAAHMKRIFARIVRKKCAERAILFQLSLDEVSQSETSAGTAVTPQRSKKKRNTRQIDVDGPLGVLELDTRRRFIKEGLSGQALHAAMVAELYSLSAASLRPLLAERKCHASPKTISRSSKYKAWEPYRGTVAPQMTVVDVGPAGSGGGKCGLAMAPTVSDVADEEVRKGALSLRRGRIGCNRAGKTRFDSPEDRQANEWAKAMGETLPPVD
jgi:hypothetical protein